MVGRVRAANWPLWLALALSLAWVLLLLMVLGRGRLPSISPEEAVVLSMPLAVGPILFFAIAAALRSGSGRLEIVDPVVGAGDAAERAEAAATGLAARLATVREALMADAQALGSLGSRLEEHGRLAATALLDLKATTEETASASARFAAGISEGQASIQEMAAQVGALDASVLRSRAEAEAAVEAIGASAATLASRADMAADAIAAALARLGAEAAASRDLVDGLVARAGAEAAAALKAGDEAAAALAEGAARHREQMEAASAEARAGLSAIGAEAARALGRHLEALTAQARELEARITAQAGATETLAAAGEKAFQRLDARLEHSASTTGNVLDSLSARIEGANRGIDALVEPVRAARAAVSDLDLAVGAARETALSAVDIFDSVLPARAVSASDAAATMAGDIERLVLALETAETRARDLALPVAEGRAAIEEAALRFREQRDAIGIAGEALVVELEQARQLIADVEKTTEQSSLAAATGLVDALSRVRDVSTQATGTMRKMLDGLVADARDSLGTAAAEAMAASFVGPIAEQARAAEEAARLAAERSAASLAALASALAGIDERSKAAMTLIGERSGAELAGAAALLTDRLAAGAIDLSAALGKPMDADDWAKWRRGERGLFGRRALALIEKSEAKAIRDLAAADSGFGTQAQRYVGEFDQLLAQLEAAGQGPLATFIRGTDSGRLAAILAEAFDG